MSYRVVLCSVRIVSRHTPPWHACHVVSCRVMSCRVLSRYAMPCHAVCHWTFPTMQLSIKSGGRGESQICLPRISATALLSGRKQQVGAPTALSAVIRCQFWYWSYHGYIQVILVDLKSFKVISSHFLSFYVVSCQIMLVRVSLAFSPQCHSIKSGGVKGEGQICFPSNNPPSTMIIKHCGKPTSIMLGPWVDWLISSFRAGGRASYGKIVHVTLSKQNKWDSHQHMSDRMDMYCCQSIYFAIVPMRALYIL
jgi:hypothetical protein